MGIKDLTGQKFGKLIVLERDMTKTGGAAYWICQCECGNKKSIRGSNLTTKTKPTRSCGCLSGQNLKNNIDLTSLVGKRFERLLVLERDLNKESGHGKNSYWICKCDCGNIVSIRKTELMRGSTKSCGCLRKELTSKNNTLDLTNKRYDKVIAIKNTFKKDALNRSYIWECKCDCGNTFTATAEYLQSGHVNSCGCSNPTSRGEQKIQTIFNDNNIHYAIQYSFQDCKNPKTGYLYKFDFAILNNLNQPIHLIEFDGEQHFLTENKWHFNIDEIKFNDEYKNQYALSHNIKLSRIPYWELNNLNLELLLDDKFLIKDGT